MTRAVLDYIFTIDQQRMDPDFVDRSYKLLYPRHYRNGNLPPLVADEMSSRFAAMIASGNKTSRRDALQFIIEMTADVFGDPYAEWTKAQIPRYSHARAIQGTFSELG
jgi:hypothetical protein